VGGFARFFAGGFGAWVLRLDFRRSHAHVCRVMVASGSRSESESTLRCLSVFDLKGCVATSITYSVWSKHTRTKRNEPACVVQEDGCCPSVGSELDLHRNFLNY
jgi:hypothetical protein